VPEVSFVIPAYNAAKTLLATIESLKAQTLDNWEAVIIDDGSRDNTWVLAHQQAQGDSRFRTVRQPNGGASHARNRGIWHARGALIAFLDADDWIAPDFLETLLPLAQEGRAVAYCAYRRILPSGRPSPVDWCPELETDPFGVLVQRCEPAIHCMLISRVLLQTVGGFDVTLRTCEDWDLWLRIARTGIPFRGSPKALASYRMRPYSLSTERIMSDDASRVLAIASSHDPRVPNPAPPLASGWPDAPGRRLAAELARQFARLASGRDLESGWLASALGPGWRARAAADASDLVEAIEAAAAVHAPMEPAAACAALLYAVRRADPWVGDLLEDRQHMEYVAKHAVQGAVGRGRWIGMPVDVRRLPERIDPGPSSDALLLICAPGTPMRRNLALPLVEPVSRAQLVQALVSLWGVSDLARAARAWRAPLFLWYLLLESCGALLRYPGGFIHRTAVRRLAGSVMRRSLARFMGASPGPEPVRRAADVAVLMFDEIIVGTAGVLSSAIGTDQLADLLQLLAAEGYQTIGFEELDAARQGRGRLPLRPLILVFADARGALDAAALAALPPTLTTAEVLFTPEEIAAGLPGQVVASHKTLSLRAGLRARRMPIATASALAATQQWRADLARQGGVRSGVAAYCDVDGVGASVLEKAGFRLILSPGSAHARSDVLTPIIPALECCGSGAIGDVLETLRPAA
jgi:hypothetical protein